MSVLINGIEMPKSCGDCPLNYDEMSCTVTGTRWWSDTMVMLDFDYTKERLYDCPLSELPSAQPERKKGRWHQRIYIYKKVEMMVCSECGNEFSYDAETGARDYNFCPNCGADMRGECNE